MVGGEVELTVQPQRSLNLVSAGSAHKRGSVCLSVLQRVQTMCVSDKTGDVMNGGVATENDRVGGYEVLWSAHRLGKSLLLMDRGCNDVYPMMEADRAELKAIIDMWQSEAVELLPSRQTQWKMAAPNLREELLAVVRLLVSSASGQCHWLSLPLMPIPNAVCPSDCTLNTRSYGACPLTQREAWPAACLHFAGVLMLCGLRSYRDAEELLSTSFSSLGGTLQRFVVQSLQEEFAIMRREVMELCVSCRRSNESEPELTTLNTGKGGSIPSNRGFYYYARTVPARCAGGVKPYASATSCDKTSPLVFTLLDEWRDDDRACGALQCQCRSYQDLTRVTCRKSDSVLFSLAVVEALSTAVVEELRQQCEKPLDFVDFIGDVVSVCAVLVYPFLVRQLRCLRYLMHSLTDASVSKSEAPLLAADVQQYERYVSAVEKFLLNFDPSFVTSPGPSFSCADRETLCTIKAGPNKGPGGARVVSNLECNEAATPPSPRRCEEKFQQSRPLWEPVAPALAAHLSSRPHAGGMMAWGDVVALFTEVKQSREAELLSLWNYWVQLRRETRALSAEVTYLMGERMAPTSQKIPRET